MQRNESPTLDDKLGQMMLLGFRGFELTDDNPIVADLRERHVGTVVLFDYDDVTGTFERNIRTPDQVRSLVRSLHGVAPRPLFVAIDQEGGRVNRLKPEYGFPETLTHRELGMRNDPDFTYEHAELIARTLRDLGINVNLAPVLDLGINKDNPIIYGKHRTFSSDPVIVSQHAEAYIRAHLEQGVQPVVKHFPGHGSSRDDTHLGMVDVTETWSGKELIPYATLIDNGLCDFVMTTHVFNKHLDERYPATLSKNILTGMLRERLGFDGVIITDDLQMKAIRKQYGLEQAVTLALEAGADIINIGNNMEFQPDAGIRVLGIMRDLIGKGVLTEDRITESYDRVMKLKEKFTNTQQNGETDDRTET
jgi:beta-N-acetylhexosaminidase